MSKEAMKLSQDLRTLADRFSEGWHDGIKIDASDIILLTDAAEALASEAKEQPAQQGAKIVRWNCPCGNKYTFHGFTEAPPQRKPLTDEEIEDIWADCPADWDDKINVLTLSRAIEAAHGIKENT